MMKKLVTITALIFLPFAVFSQSRGGNVVVDTVAIKGDERIVIFSDGTWKKVGQEEREERERIKWTPDPDDQAEIFEKSWVNDEIPSYNTTLSELPEFVELHLADEGDTTSYHCPYVASPSSRYGYRRGRRHTGTDIPFPYGVPVRAAFNGKVRASIFNHGYGNLVIIRHANGLETFYAHLAKRNVNAGDWVKAGDIIGLGGSTGHSTGPHLHFETRFQGFPFDPERIIDFSNGQLRSADFTLRKSYFGGNSRFAASGNYIPQDDEGNPTVKAKAKASKKAAYYKVRSGDNLSKIAKRNGTTVKELCRINKISPQKPLKVGQSIRVK